MSAWWEDDESPEPLAEEEVFDLVGGALEHLHMGRSLEQITARGYTHHRRRTATTAMAGVAAITALGAAVALAQSGNAARATSTASARIGVASTAPRMTDPDWTVVADPAAGYAVDITALGDVAQLDATLTSLGVELNVVEAPPSASQSVCTTMGAATSTTSIPATGTAPETTTTSTSPSATTSASSSPTQSTPATADSATDSDPSTPSTATTSPDAPSPTPTPVSFGVSGTAAAFTFGDLPKESAFSFISTDGRSRPLLGTVRISDECLPVFAARS